MSKYGVIPPGGNANQVLSKATAEHGDVTWVTVAGGTPELPVGGSAGQALTKIDATDYNVQWEDLLELPPGGTAGQILQKQSSTDGDAGWIGAPEEPPAGGLTGQVLKKNSNSDYDYGWAADNDTQVVPAGGTTAQYLRKTDGADFNLEWATLVNDLPTGGSTGQVLKKDSATDYDCSWQNDSDTQYVPAGGSANQVLSKIDGTDYNVQWATPAGGGGGTLSMSEVFRGTLTNGAQNISGAEGSTTDYQWDDAIEDAGINHTDGENEIQFLAEGVLSIQAAIVTTDSGTNNRLIANLTVDHLNSAGVLQYSYGLGAMYIRDDNNAYDSGGAGGGVTIPIGANDRIRVRTTVLDDATAASPCYADTTLSHLRIWRMSVS